MITDDKADEIVAAGITEVSIRSVFTCSSRYGVCAKCYGKNMATGRPIQVGEAVGVIAAQSIGEPGTQLTMRTFTRAASRRRATSRKVSRVSKSCSKRVNRRAWRPVRGRRHRVRQRARQPEAHHHPRRICRHRQEGVPASFQRGAQDQERRQSGAGHPAQRRFGQPADILRIKGVKGVQDYILNEVSPSTARRASTSTTNTSRSSSAR